MAKLRTEQNTRMTVQLRKRGDSTQDGFNFDLSRNNHKRKEFALKWNMVTIIPWDVTLGRLTLKDKNCWNSSPLKFTGRQKRIWGCYLDMQQENVSQKWKLQINRSEKLKLFYIGIHLHSNCYFHFAPVSENM